MSEPRTKRRLLGACDFCKRRKIRCDGGQPGTRCSHCVRNGIDCTHADIFKTLSSAKSYVAALEQRVEKMEALLRKLLPGIDFTEHLENDTDIEPLRPHPVEALPRNDADSIAQTLSKLQLDPEKNRFFGKSSGIQLVQVALNFQSNLTGIAPEITRRLQKRTEFWQPAFWIYPPLGDDSPKYEFPEPALMTSLIDLYFERIHPYYPLLHQPTFRTQVADELHLRDHRFAATLLMVCALGARHSEDPNVLLDNSFLRHTAGWKWHNQVRVLPKNLIYKPDLYELQTIALSSIYLQGLSSTAIGWNQIGFGLRRAQDVGAHRRRKDALSNSADNERWKRVFWVLLCQEWDTGTTTGRPIAMHEQDFDQVYPIECDDEFWDTNFEQPSNKPSQLTYFIYLIKLLEIQAAVTSNIYITRKPRDFSGQVSSPSDAQSIMAFDSSLNSWLSQVPDHLKWDPERQDKIHFHQSALLHTRFFYVQILLHRPFIPAPLELTKAGALPSLAICTSAARSVVGIFEALLKRNEHLESFFLTMAFTAGIVLLLNAWSGKRSGFAYNPVKELEQVEMCLKLLRSGEEQHRVAGRYSDILTRLMDAGARDTLEVLLDMKPPALTVVPPSPQPGYEAYSAQDWSYSNFPNLDNLLNTDSPFVFPDGDFQGLGNLNETMLQTGIGVGTSDDPSILSMWSTAPSGFNVDDWSYIMAEDQYGEPTRPMYPANPSAKDEPYLRREAGCGFWS